MFTHLTRPRKFDTSDDDDRISSDKDGPMISGSAAQNCEVVCWFGRSEEDASDICSPPLWKTSNPHTNYTQLSAAAKAQAVVRGQQELMEMIKNMPESSYELSLKDIVEQNHHRTHIPCEEDRKIGHYSNANPLSQFTKEELSKRKKTNGISASVDNGGFLLKMVLPFDFRSKGKKRIVVSESKHGCSKVSPRPSSVRTRDGLSWFGDNESIGRTSRSDRSRRVGSSRTNINNNRVSSRIFLKGCWSVFSFNKKVSDD